MLIRYGTDKYGKPVQKAIIYTKEDHLIPLSKIDADAIFIIKRLHDAGFSAYIVGGAVRDLLLGNTPKDFDIVTNATPSKIRRFFRNSRIIGRRFRLVHVVFGAKIIEVSTFRSTVEGSVGNIFGSMDEDVLRRDFTLNALYYDPLSEQIIDYMGGVRDIKKHVIKNVIPLDRIFTEDPVRMIRAIKYSVSTEAKLPHSIRSKIKHSAYLLSKISPSRLTEELLKIINSSHAAEIVQEMLSMDVYKYLQPNATKIILSNKQFESEYLENLKKLDDLVKTDKTARLGNKLYFFIYDYAKTLYDWKNLGEIKVNNGELYENVWKECRNFVLPMNPQRKELEYAVRQVIRSFGAPSKKSKKKSNEKKYLS